MSFQHHQVSLSGPTDVEGFRIACRALVTRGVPPESVTFSAPEPTRTAELDTASEYLDVGSLRDSENTERSALSLPTTFVKLAECVLLHHDPERFGRVYGMLWLIVHDRKVWLDTLHPLRVTLERMARAVRREMHKMKAFVRFRPTQDGTQYVAWFEPAHYVLEAVAPFFVKRFPNMHWAILTPLASAWWNQETLFFGPPARPQDAPDADAGEALWLAYYRQTFNPARLKVAAMKREMPVRFWKHMPETVHIPALVRASAERTQAMLDAPPTRPRRAPIRAQSRVPDADLSELAQHAAHCQACPLGQHATQVVWGRGASRARLMVVGEAPGDQEDLKGEPFIGPAGQVLRQAMNTLGWSVESIYLTNAVKHFKFTVRGKRRLHKTPAQQEIEACTQWLEAEIAQVKPQAIVALGATAARALLRYEVRIGEHTGQWLRRADGLPVLITAHPAALLRAAPESFAVRYQHWVQVLDLASEFTHSQINAYATSPLAKER